MTSSMAADPSSGHFRRRFGQIGSQGGSALLLVLIMGALLTGLTLVAMRTFTASARAAAVYVDEVRAEELGRSGIDLALAWISLLNGKQRQAGSVAQAMDRGGLRVDFVAETGRVDINQAPPDLLAFVIGGAGLERDLARTLAGAIVDWRDPNGQTKPIVTTGQAVASTSAPASGGRLFLSPFELQQVPGMTPEVLAKILPLVTVVSGADKINPLIADRAMLSVLFEGDGEQADAYLGRRARGFDKVGAEIEPFSARVRPFLSADADAGDGVRIFVEAKAGRIVRRYEGVIRLAGGDRSDASVLSWQSVVR